MKMLIYCKRCKVKSGLLAFAVLAGAALAAAPDVHADTQPVQTALVGQVQKEAALPAAADSELSIESERQAAQPQPVQFLNGAAATETVEAAGGVTKDSELVQGESGPVQAYEKAAAGQTAPTLLAQAPDFDEQQAAAANQVPDSSSSGVSTLDAAGLTASFEKARLRGANRETIVAEVQKAGRAVPANLTYIDDFYDDQTGTSGTAFKDNASGKVIPAYTGTNRDGNGLQDAVAADIIGIGLARGQHYQPAYDFYDKIADQYGAQNMVIAGHSLGGNVAQRVALKKNAPETVVYNAAPLYIPAVASLGNRFYDSLREKLKGFDLPSNKVEAEQTIAAIKNDQTQFTGRVTRITTQKDWLNNSVRFLGAVYLGEEHIISNSGGHSLREIVNDPQQIAFVKSIVSL